MIPGHISCSEQVDQRVVLNTREGGGGVRYGWMVLTGTQSWWRRDECEYILDPKVQRLALLFGDCHLRSPGS